MCQRGFGLGADGVLYDRWTSMERWACIFITPMAAKLQSVEMVSVFFAKYLLDHEYVKEQKFRIKHLSGPIEVECLNSRATEFRVKMGKASFSFQRDSGYRRGS